MPQKKLRIYFYIACAGLILFFYFLKSQVRDEARDPASLLPLQKTDVAKMLNDVMENSYPSEIELTLNNEKIKAHINYSIDKEKQEFISKMFSSYKPDYGAFVAMDAQTGQILALHSYTKEENELGNLAIKSIFPGASIFKVITASAAIDTGKMNAQTVVPFNGRSHTLYKSHLKSDKETKWTRHLPLKNAFANSINTVFGKIGAYILNDDDLLKYALKYGFNAKIPADFPVESGQTMIFDMPTEDDVYQKAEAASGYTRDITLSPVHGALIASTVANDGNMMQPYLIESIKSEDGRLLYKPFEKIAKKVLSLDSAKEMQVLMEETVARGTSRKHFKSLLRDQDYDDVEMGGKTGSLTAANKLGKCDWFVGYAIRGERKIAIASLTVHKKYWTVKSSYLASQFIKEFFEDKE